MRYPSYHGKLVSPYEIYKMPDRSDILRRGLTNNHHGWFPRNNYNTPIEKLFRGLVTHMYPLYIPDHTGRGGLHNIYSAPVKPSEIEMIDVLDEYIAMRGVLHIANEKSTNNHYEVSANNWNRIKQHIKLNNDGFSI